MGSWGTALYSDDDAQDFRDRYIELLAETQSHEKAYIALYEEYHKDFENMPEIEAIFWFVLADRQCYYGYLIPEVKEKAIEFLQRDEHLEVWQEDGGKLLEKRKQVLDKLKDKLNLPLPEERKLPKPPIPIIANPGDVFALKLSRLRYKHFFADEADISLIKDKYRGKYVAFQFLGLEKLGKQEDAIIRIYNWCNESLPTLEEIQKLNFIPSYTNILFFCNCPQKLKQQKFNNGIDVSTLDEWDKRFIKIGNMMPTSYNIDGYNTICYFDTTLAYFFYMLEKKSYTYENFIKLLKK